METRNQSERRLRGWTPTHQTAPPPGLLGQQVPAGNVGTEPSAGAHSHARVRASLACLGSHSKAGSPETHH